MKKKSLLLMAAVCVLLSGCSLKELPGLSSTKEPETTSRPAETEKEAPHPGEELPTEETDVSGPPGHDEEGKVPPTIEEFPNSADGPAAEPPKESWDGGCRILLASDIHYLSAELTDFQSAFTYFVEHGDGKVTGYVWQITDAFIEAVKEEKPDVVILSGDLTLNGEKKSHQEFAAKLRELEDTGIPVIVIPGNHDINNKDAAGFVEGEKVVAASITPEEFAEIYAEFGYDEAVSRDPSSLSYIYQIDDYNRAMMLDTCQYMPYNQVGGMIREDTYDWIEDQMEEAWELGMNVIPVGHHNLLDESEIYVQDCTIEHSEQLIAQLESWSVPLFLSGHLHVQHFKQSGDSGIYEIVTSSLSTPPCQYGLLSYGDDGSFHYHTKALDMEAWAKARESTDENLLHFNSYSKKYLANVFYNQAQDEFDRVEGFEKLTNSQRKLMANVYAELNSACYAGKAVEVKDEAIKKPGWKLWSEHGYPSILSQYLEFIVRDGVKDYNVLEAE